MMERALTRPGSSGARLATWLLLVALAGCAPGGAGRAAVRGALGAALAASPARLEAAAPPAPAAAGAAERPMLPTTPEITVKVGTLGNAYYGPYYIAQTRGYFTEVGINAEFQNTATALEQLPALVQGQLHVGSCSTHVACFNAISRGSDLRIVGDLSSMGRTDRSRGGGGLVVRTDLWDSGAIREPRDLVGRQVALVAGTGERGPRAHLALAAQPRSRSVERRLDHDELPGPARGDAEPRNRAWLPDRAAADDRPLARRLARAGSARGDGSDGPVGLYRVLGGDRPARAASRRALHGRAAARRARLHERLRVRRRPGRRHRHPHPRDDTEGPCSSTAASSTVGWTPTAS